MFDEGLKKSISERFDGALFDEPMSAHTTFRVGGACDCYISADKDNISDILDFCKNNGLNYTVIGNGSNILCADEGFRGVVINVGETNYNVNTLPFGNFVICGKARTRRS